MLKMQAVFKPDNMELDSCDVPAHVWGVQQTFTTQAIKLEVGSRITRDNNMLELGKKLLLKSKLGLTDEVKELMSRGAPFSSDWVGTSPLHWAAHFNHVDVTELLLKAGISRDARNKVDRTPLHVAAQKGHLQILQLLLHYGADVNCKDMLRMTPLHWAAESGSVECVQTLLSYGADPSVVSKFDKTPAKVALDAEHHQVSQIIEAAAVLEPSARIAKTNIIRPPAKSVKTSEPTSSSSPGSSMKSCGRKNKIGIIVTKQEPHEIQPEPVVGNNLASANTLNLLQAHGITMLEPDNDTVISSAVESGQTVMLTEAGKLALDLAKVNNPNINQRPQTKIPLNQKILGTGKKVITIRADQLINMTKERKVIIKQGKTLSLQPARIFQGKIYQQDQEDILIEKITSKLAEARRQADLFRIQLEKKEREAEDYKRQLELIHRARQKLKSP